MSKRKAQDKRQQLEAYTALQARLTYLRDDLRGGHWMCRTQWPEFVQGKRVAIRTAGGIDFLSST